MLIPGLLLASSFIAHIVVRYILRPSDGPPPAIDGVEPPLMQKLAQTIAALAPPLIIVFAVLGLIMTGVATPTEAAATGATCMLLLTIAYRRLTFQVLKQSLERTVRVTTMILMVVVAGSTFASVFAASGGLSTINSLIGAANLGAWQTLSLILLIAFITGFTLDPLVIILILVPIAVLVVTGLGFDQVWFCVVFLIILQTADLTPPMAPSIFYLRGIAPPELKLGHMYQGIMPFIALQLLVLTLVLLFPAIVF